MGGTLADPVIDMKVELSDEKVLDNTDTLLPAIGDVFPSCKGVEGVEGAIRCMDNKLSSILGRSRFLWNRKECSSIMVR